MGGGRFSFICALSASRGRVRERAAIQLIFQPLHCAVAKADKLRCAIDADALAEHAFGLLDRVLWPKKAKTHEINEMATKNPSSGFELSCMTVLLAALTTPKSYYCAGRLA